MSDLVAEDNVLYVVAYAGSDEYIVSSLEPGITLATNHTIISGYTKQEVIDEAAPLNIIITEEDFDLGIEEELTGEGIGYEPEIPDEED